MKFFKTLLIAVIVLANLVFAQPSLADKPKYLKNPDYIEVTKTLDSLLTAQQAETQTENYNPEEIQNKIDELEFQKYALETGINWGQCQNATGNTLAVYGPQPDFDDDDDYEAPYDNALYFLANGQTTKEKWDCQGVYLPSGAKTTISSSGQNQDVQGPIAVKIADGTQLVIKTNPDTAAVEFSIPPTQVFKAGELNWFIPNVSQAVIDTRVPNAPVSKIANSNNLVVKRNLEPAVVQSNTPYQRELESKSQSQPQSKPEPVSPKTGVYRR